MEKPPVFVSILAGGIAGATETVITYPAEFIKTRRQLPIHANQPVSSSSILLSTIRNHGFGGLYSGCRVLVISNFCKSSVRFFSFETARTFLSRSLSHNPAANGHSASVNVLAGLCAGITESILVVTPGEALKTKFVHDAASRAPQFARLSLPVAVARIARQDGIRALWRGVGPVLGKQGTNSAVRFGTFGILQEQVSRRLPSVQGGAGSTLVVGALSGVVTVYASMPFDNIKTRMQSIGSNYSGLVDCGKRLLAAEGVKVFWRGTTPRLVRVMLSSSISFTVYDMIVKQFQQFHRSQRAIL